MMQFLGEKNPTARKTHRCQACGTTIQPGEQYNRQSNVNDGRAYDWVSCLPCRDLGREVDAWIGGWDGITEEDYWEWAHEHARGSQPELAALAYLARNGCTCEACEQRTGGPDSEQPT